MMLTAANLLEELLVRARAVTETTTLPLADTLGLVLSSSQFSAITVPPLDNSAMDGYAVRVQDISAMGIRLPG